MASASLLGGSFTLSADLTVTRVGYGSMQLAGPHVFGPPADRDGALAVLKAVVDLGIRVGALRDAEGNRPQALSRDELRHAVHSNLTNLGLDVLDVVSLRVGGFDSPTPGSIAEPFTAMVELQQEGLIRHLGITTVTSEQVIEAQSIAPIVSVQNFYNIANRYDDALVDSLAEQGIAFVPYFPLGGFSPLQSDTLSHVAERLETTPMAVALA